MTRVLGLFKLGKPTRGSWWNTSIATAHCIPICMQMVYQENSIPSNQQVKNNCNLHFRATIQSLMNRKERRKWQTYERIDFHWQLVWLVLYSTLMSWNSQKILKKALFFIHKLHKNAQVNSYVQLFPTPKLYSFVKFTGEKNSGAFLASLLNIYFRLVLFWTCAITVAPVLGHKLEQMLDWQPLMLQQNKIKW